MRRAALCRLVYGLSLLIVSERVVRAVTGGSGGIVPLIGRVLGARHVVQALTLDRRRSRGWLAVGVVTDVLHALSMVVVAALSRKYRYPAVLDGTGALAWALSGLRAIRRVG